MLPLQLPFGLNNQCQLQQMGPQAMGPLEWGHWLPSEHFLINTRESPSNILSSEQKFRTSRETHILSFSMKLARETHILASNLQRHQ